MRIRTILTAAAVALAVALPVAGTAASPATATGSTTAGTGARADLVLRHGAVETGTGRRAQAVAVRDGRIVYVGSDAGVRRFIGRATEVVDLRGRTLMPGIQDGHAHLSPQLPTCDLEYAFLTVAETRARIQDCLDAEPGKGPNDWLSVVNWDLPGMKPAGTVPSKALLDALDTDRPIFVFSDDGHNALTNSRGLAVAGITKDTPDPKGGVIVRDPAGEPTGYLKEDTAIGLVTSKIPPAPLAERVEGLRRTLAYVTARGLTAYQPQLLEESDLQAWKYLADRHELPGRVRASLALDANEAYADLPGTLRELRRLKRTYEGPGFKITTVGEIFADGVIEYPNQTARLLAPYRVKNKHGKWVPGPTKGPLRVPQAHLNRVVAALDKAGWQVHIHAIGDGAAREALNAFAYARRHNDNRRIPGIIAHDQLVAPSDYARFRRLNVVAAISTEWAEKDPYTMDALKPYIGVERWKRMYPWRSMLRAGARLANGSDFPVQDLNPMAQLQVAVTRVAPETNGVRRYEGPLNARERISLTDAIRIHTADTAYLLGLQRRTGTLAVGKQLDAIILSGDLRRTPIRKVRTLQVRATYVGGVLRAGRP